MEPSPILRQVRTTAWVLFLLSLVAAFLSPSPADLVAGIVLVGSIVTLLAARARIRVLTGTPLIRDRKAWVVALIALILASLDTFLFGQGVFAIALCLAGFLYYLPRAIGAHPDPALFRLRVIKAVVVISAGAASIAAIVTFNAIAEARALAVIAAVESFKGRFGRYPEKLDEVVPLYLSEVPMAKPAGMMRTFDYRNLEGEHTLMYTVVPPFGRKVYTFERKRWSALD